jgi:hypothetical protein
MALKPLYATPAKDPSATRVGELPDGTPIWEREFTQKVGEEPVVINGQPQWVMAGQTPVKPRMRAVMASVKRRYVEVVQPNGGVFRNFDFEPDPQEKARLERRQRVRETQEQLAEALVDNGLSVDALIGALKAEDAPKRRAKADAKADE